MVFLRFSYGFLRFETSGKPEENRKKTGRKPKENQKKTKRKPKENRRKPKKTRRKENHRPPSYYWTSLALNRTNPCVLWRTVLVAFTHIPLCCCGRREKRQSALDLWIFLPFGPFSLNEKGPYWGKNNTNSQKREATNIAYRGPRSGRVSDHETLVVVVSAWVFFIPKKQLELE